MCAISFLPQWVIKKQMKELRYKSSADIRHGFGKPQSQETTEHYDLQLLHCAHKYFFHMLHWSRTDKNTTSWMCCMGTLGYQQLYVAPQVYVNILDVAMWRLPQDWFSSGGGGDLEACDGVRCS